MAVSQVGAAIPSSDWNVRLGEVPPLLVDVWAFIVGTTPNRWLTVVSQWPAIWKCFHSPRGSDERRTIDHPFRWILSAF